MFNKQLFWKNIEEFNIQKIIDLLWYLDFDDIDFDKVSKNKLLQEIYTAKGYINDVDCSEQFELDVLIAIKNSPSKVKADLNFEFICNSCKKIHPIYDSRCPHCHNILTFIVEAKLAKAISGMKSLV